MPFGVAGAQGECLTELPRQVIADQPRARGEARVAFCARGGVTRLSGLRQSGSMRALFPRSDAKNLQMVLTNTAGGVTGGDRFSTNLVLDQGACVSVTTQAAERAYRAQPGLVGRVDNRIDVSGGSRVNWLPQETILFDGCSLQRRLTIELDATASALVVEPLVFGRAAMNEDIRAGAFNDHIEIKRSGSTVFLDRTQLVGDISAQLARPAVADGDHAMALVLFAAPNADVMLENLRVLLPLTAGASLVSEDLLVARILAADSFELRKSLLPVIDLLHDDLIPRPWMI